MCYVLCAMRYAQCLPSYFPPLTYIHFVYLEIVRWGLVLWVKTEQVCATCAMWSGKRKETFSFVEPEVHQGMCLVEGERVTVHKGACHLWYGLPLEFPIQSRNHKEPVSD